jgi:Zn-dependent protease with chaperone function
VSPRNTAWTIIITLAVALLALIAYNTGIVKFLIGLGIAAAGLLFMLGCICLSIMLIHNEWPRWSEKKELDIDPRL